MSCMISQEKWTKALEELSIKWGGTNTRQLKAEWYNISSDTHLPLKDGECQLDIVNSSCHKLYTLHYEAFRNSLKDYKDFDNRLGRCDFVVLALNQSCILLIELTAVRTIESMVLPAKEDSDETMFDKKQRQLGDTLYTLLQRSSEIKNIVEGIPNKQRICLLCYTIKKQTNQPYMDIVRSFERPLYAEQKDAPNGVKYECKAIENYGFEYRRIAVPKNKYNI